jgi:hypothetical protein
MECSPVTLLLNRRRHPVDILSYPTRQSLPLTCLLTTIFRRVASIQRESDLLPALAWRGPDSKPSPRGRAILGMRQQSKKFEGAAISGERQASCLAILIHGTDLPSLPLGQASYLRLGQHPITLWLRRIHQSLGSDDDGR